jgi:4-amino-4-deoxy-L-arabinose transferase-like glycosyltransferase
VTPEPVDRAARLRTLLVAPSTGVALLTLIFLAISAWWLASDLRMVNVDDAKHANIALQWHNALRSGDVLEPLRAYDVYPPGTHIVGALGTFVFGYNVGAVVMAQNLVFVPLLALGCYGTATVAFGPRAGVLAALFAFAVPMVMSLFHMSLPDGPLTAMVAVAVWLLLASDRFSRLGLSALAGVAAGLGMYTKGTFVLFVAGVIAMLLLRGGWRNPKGFLAFGVIATAIAGPYYADRFTSIEAQTEGHLTSRLPIWYGSVPYPDRASVENFTWYFWNLVNNQLYLPLTLFFLVGLGWAVWRLVRVPHESGYIPELLAGGLVGYLAVSMLVLKDPRYTLPCLVFVAVLATAWIATLQRTRRIALTAALLAVAIVNVATQNIGFGGVRSIDLPMAVDSPISQYTFTLVDESGFFGGPPSRQGEPIVKLLDGLYERGAPTAIFDETTFQTGGYHLTGLTLLALHTRGSGMPGFTPAFVTDRKDAWIVRADVATVGARPCLMSPLARDGSGIYVYRGRVPKDLSRARPDCP